MSEKDANEDLRSVPADQRSLGPNETVILSSSELASGATSAAAGQARKIKGTPKLVGISDAVANRSLELTKPKTMIGRQSRNDIVIEDSSVSARHAQIVNEDGIWRVVNLISTNGTSVNGRTSIVSYLAPGDVIAFGRVEMIFEAEEGESPIASGDARGRSGGRSSSTSPVLWAVIAASAIIAIGAGAWTLGLI